MAGTHAAFSTLIQHGKTEAKKIASENFFRNKFANFLAQLFKIFCTISQNFWPSAENSAFSHIDLRQP